MYFKNNLSDYSVCEKPVIYQFIRLHLLQKPSQKPNIKIQPQIGFCPLHFLDIFKKKIQLFVDFLVKCTINILIL